MPRSARSGGPFREQRPRTAFSIGTTKRENRAAARALVRRVPRSALRGPRWRAAGMGIDEAPRRGPAIPEQEGTARRAPPPSARVCGAPCPGGVSRRGWFRRFDLPPPYATDTVRPLCRPRGPRGRKTTRQTRSDAIRAARKHRHEAGSSRVCCRLALGRRGEWPEPPVARRGAAVRRGAARGGETTLLVISETRITRLPWRRVRAGQ